MKKKVLLFSLFVLSFVLFGCTFNNTPKAKVESLLMKYQKNTDTIITELSKSDKLLKDKIKNTFLIQQNIKATILLHFLLIILSQVIVLFTLNLISFLDLKFLNLMFIISIIFSLLTITHIVHIFSFQEDLNAFSSLKSNLYRDSSIYYKDKEKKTIYIY